MTRCLRQLQTTNPNLLLTASELRVAERDSRYVPAVAEALALILANAVSNPAPVEQILEWDTATDGSMSSKSSSDAKVLGTLIEERLRLVLAKPRKSSRKKPKRGEKSAKRRANDASDHESLDEATQPEHSDTEETEEMADLAASAVETLSKKPKAVSVSDTPVESDYDDWL
jgi:hypothetical protein